MLALFRCDASPDMGAGHVMRCMTLASELRARGWRCHFATNDATPDIVPGVREFHRVDPLLVIDGASAYDVVVVDGYHLKISVERAMRSIGERIVVLDDLPNRAHDCDVLLDQTLNRYPHQYDDLVADHCEVLAGVEYALLREEFLRWRPAALERRESQSGRIDRILVSMGATDANHATGAILGELSDVGSPAEVVVLANSGAPHFDQVVEQCHDLSTERQGFHVAVDAADVAEVMAFADIAIGAAGTTSWERATLGLPTLMVSTASNQLDVASALHAVGAACDLGPLSAESIAAAGKALRVLLREPAHVLSMSRSAASICDGRGVHRALPRVVGAGCGSIKLRAAHREDSETLFQWQQLPEVRRYARNPRPPTRAEHEAWVDGVLDNANRQLFIVVLNEEPVGMLRLDMRAPREDSNRSFEVSILVDPSASGQGIASSALQAIRRLEPTADIWAFVLPENDVSRRLFLRAGYVAADSDWFVQRVNSCADKHDEGLV